MPHVSYILLFFQLNFRKTRDNEDLLLPIKYILREGLIEIHNYNIAIQMPLLRGGGGGGGGFF